MSEKESRLFAVIGLGRFGLAVAKRLTEMGMDVIAIDKNEDKVNEISNIVNHAVQLNATNEKSLREIGMPDVEVAVVAVGEDIASSILICSYLKNDLKIKKVIAKANDQKHGAVLSKLSVDRVIYPERESGERLAETLLSPNIFDLIELSDTYQIMEIKAPDAFVDKTVLELDLRKKYRINVIAIKRKIPKIVKDNFSGYDEKTIITPEPSEGIIKGDILVLIGTKENLEKIKKI